jgi:hypothetical protein
MSHSEAGIADAALESVAALLRDMRSAGLAHPEAAIRAALAAGEVIRFPILAWIAGVPPLAILWGDRVRELVVSGNVIGDAAATTRAIGVAIDVEHLTRELAEMT